VEITWTSLDTWIAVTAALAAMSCALPGVFLVLRRQSMLGDALSHTALPGIVAAFLFAHWMRVAGWWDEVEGGSFHALLFGGAVLAGVLTAFLTEVIQKIGRVESSAALGVIYTSLFALGLLLIRLFADNVHLDAECVLFGTVETVVFNTLPDSDIPRAAVVNGCVLLVNFTLLLLCLKELRLTTFDPALAESSGISSSLVHYVLMAVTSVTLVAAFESVGSILVITVLVAPAATAFLLTERLWSMILVALLVAGGSAFLGHWLAIATPVLIFQPLGFTTVDDTNTAGMIAMAIGGLFFAAFLFSPKKGVISQSVQRSLLSFRIVCEDLLGILYRLEEFARSDDAIRIPTGAPGATIDPRKGLSGKLLDRLAVWRLTRQGYVEVTETACVLTDSGRSVARQLVRSHRLWEAYMAKHFPLASDHLHEMAHRVEHFLDGSLREEIETELDGPGEDPHGRSIPDEP